jgi:hypothetical protein
VALDWELTEIENLLHELARERREDGADPDVDLAPGRPTDVGVRQPRRHLRVV